MTAVGIALLWGAYAFGLWSYCLLRGYNVTLQQIFSSKWPPTGTPVLYVMTGPSGP